MQGSKILCSNSLAKVTIDVDGNWFIPGTGSVVVLLNVMLILSHPLNQ